LSTQFDVVIAGGGIAGLTAGLTSARLGRKTLVLTGDILGGQLLSINKVDGFPGFPDGIPGYDLCPIVQEQAMSAGAEFAMEELVEIVPRDGAWRVASRTGEDYDARAVILATGSSLRALGVPGEERLRGKGVSHCASCDAPLMRDRVVAVIGGGDSAAQEALTLAEFASRVIVLHRGTALGAQAIYRDAVTQHPRIELRFNAVVEEILGDGSVMGARVRDGATGKSADMDLAGMFVYIGFRPNTEFLAGRIALDPSGQVRTDAAMRTEMAGLCAAGSVRSGWLGRAVASAGEGASAALSADRYLGRGGSGSDAWRAD